MSDLTSSIEGLLKSEKYSDLTLKCQGVPFKVHCAIVCTRSPVLAAAADGSFMEATSREIDLSADDLDIVRAMINYLYTGDYDDTRDLENVDRADDPAESNAVPEAPPEPVFMPALAFGGWLDSALTLELEPPKPLNLEALVFNVKMYVAADKYQIPGLKEVASRKYGTVVNNCWNTTEFSDSVQLLWENTTESDVSLKNVILMTVGSNVPALLSREEFVEVLRSHGDLGVGVLRMSFCPVPI